MNIQKIGAFIAENRKKNGMTQQQLANRLGVTNKTVSRWENGNYMPDLSLLQPLAENLDVSLNELLRGEYIAQETAVTKSEENLQHTFVYAKQKIAKSQRIIFAITALCMIVMLVAGYLLTQQNYLRNGLFDTAEKCRNHTLERWDIHIGQDSVYWRNEMYKGRWYQVCMYITHQDSGIFLIEKQNDKYKVADSTINKQMLSSADDAYIQMHVLYGYGHPKPFETVYIHWDAVPGDVEIKFRDQSIEKMATVNGYTLWYRITDCWPDFAEITVA